MTTLEIAQVSLEVGDESPYDVQRNAMGTLVLGRLTVCSTGTPVASPPVVNAGSMVTRLPKSPVSPGTEACMTCTLSAVDVASGVKSE